MGTTYALLAAAAAVAVLIVVYVLIGRKTPPAPPAAACGGDADCGPGRTCVQGACVSPAASCGGDGDCPAGQRCNLDTGRCEKPLPGNVCANDFQCAPGQACFRGHCRPQGYCLIDSDCEKGLKCLNNSCVAKDACATGDDCGDGLKCYEKRCVQNTFCKNDADCKDSGDVSSRIQYKCEDSVCKDVKVSPCSNDYWIDDVGNVPLSDAGRVMCRAIYGADTGSWSKITYGGSSRDCGGWARSFTCNVPQDPPKRETALQAKTQWTECSSSLWRGRAPKPVYADLVCKGVYGPNAIRNAANGQINWHDCGNRGAPWWTAQWACVVPS